MCRKLKQKNRKKAFKKSAGDEAATIFYQNFSISAKVGGFLGAA
jgi:hypothetical protein